MFKSLLAAIMIAAGTPLAALDSSENTATAQFNINSSDIQSIWDHAALGSPYNDNFYWVYQKIGMTANTDEVEINCCIYSQLYMNDNATNGQYYYVDIARTPSQDFSPNIDKTPKAMFYFKIKNKAKLYDSAIALQFLHPTTSDLYLDTNQYGAGRNDIEWYYTSQDNWDKFYMAANNTNKNFIENCKDEIENSIYATKLPDITQRTNINSFQIDTTIENSMLNLGTYYIVMFVTLTSGSYQNIQTIRTTSDRYPYLQYVTIAKMDYERQQVIAVSNYEVIDIPNLAFTILTMPFSFISQAFNLTLFANTTYEINISNLFLAIIGVLAFVFLIKLILGKKG